MDVKLSVPCCVLSRIIAMTRASKLFNRLNFTNLILWLGLAFSHSINSNDIIFDDGFESYSGTASLSLAGGRTAIMLVDNLGLRWSVDLKGYDCAVVRVISPAGGVIWYLSDQDTWTETQTCLPYEISNSSIGLPEAVAGSWFMQVSFQNETGELLATTAIRVLATDIPIVKISQNRRYAATGDTIRAFANVATGGSAEDVKLFAILTQPDGSQVSLPGFSSNLVSAYNGPIENNRYTLLSDEFMSDGLYTIRVNLVDSNNSTIAMDESAFELCTLLTSVEGIVTDAGSIPLGNNAVIATVSAVGLNGQRYSTNIGIDGSYQLSLAPGRYLVSADVFDDTGFFQNQAAKVLDIDCSITPVILDLRADIDLLAGASHAVDHSAPIHLLTQRLENFLAKFDFQLIASALASSPSASDGMKQPSLYIPTPEIYISDPDKQWIGRGAAEIVKSRLRLKADNVSIIYSSDFIDMLDEEAQQQLSGNDEVSSLPEIAALLGGQQFVARITAGLLGNSLVITVAVLPVQEIGRGRVGSASIVVDWPENGTTETLGQIGRDFLIPETESKIVDNFSPDNVSLFNAIRNRQKEVRADTKVPIDPKKPTLTLDPDPVLANENINAESVMEDGDGFKLPGLSVDFDVIRKSYDPDLKALVPSDEETYSDSTDAQGMASVSFVAGGDYDPLRNGTGVVNAVWSETGLELFANDTYVIKTPDTPDSTKVELDSPDMEIEPEETTTINIGVKNPDGSPKTNAEVVLALAGVPGNANANEAAAAEARLSRPTVTTDANGKATVEFTAGSQGGAASVIGTVTEYTGGGNVSVVYDTVDYLVGGNILVQVNSLPATIEAGSASVIEVQLLRTFGPVSNGPLTLTLTGSGALQDTSGFTDSEGKFTTIYTAPAQGAGSATIRVDLTVAATVYKGQTVVNYTTTSNIIEGNVFISSQAQLNQLAGVTTINGLLTINGSGLTVFDLAPLSFLTSVKGLTIQDTILYDLEGLESLIAIDGPVKISGNAILATLKGLNNLTRINGFWALIYQNRALSTTAELESLQIVGNESNNSGELRIEGWGSGTESRTIEVDLPALTRVVARLRVDWLTSNLILPQLVRVGSLSFFTADFSSMGTLKPSEFILPALTQIDGGLSVNAVGCQSVDCVPFTDGIETISLPELTTVGSLRLDGGWDEIQGCNNYSCYRLMDNAGIGSLKTIDLPKLTSWGTGALDIKGFYGPITINLNTINGPTGDLVIVANKDVTLNLPPALPVGRYVQIYNNIGMGDDTFWTNWVETALDHDGFVFIGGNQ
jgi:hypothetical protein